MAARLNRMHQDSVRAKIQASQLINALEDHVLKGTKLKQSQVRAALGLLAKCVPDIQRTEHTGEIVQRYVIETPTPAENPQEWASQHAPTTTQ